ncbi:MAG: PilZ domain-containing protein, partial [Planctomycetes bacterium]|nr:PilZ domain-containing protein [Planctomycetota bacterium]
VLSMAARQKIPASATYHDANRWLTFHGRASSIEEGRLAFDALEGSGRVPSQPIGVGSEMGISFRMGPYKYSFTTTVAAVRPYQREDGVTVLAMTIQRPRLIQQMDRRIYPRTEVSLSHKARVTFWPGGRALEPAEQSPDRPVWGGTLVDLSTHGFGVRTSMDAGNLLETGDLVGARLLFGDTPVPLYVNVQLRHVGPEGSMCVLGLQFVGMELTEEGRASQALIDQRVKQLEKESGTG